jgi:hypothetical protein
MLKTMGVDLHSGKSRWTPGELRRAVEAAEREASEWEAKYGTGSKGEQTAKVRNHTQERPAYYVELGRMLDVPSGVPGLEKGGPYIGPKGGKWADPKHTIPWDAKGGPTAGEVHEQAQRTGGVYRGKDEAKGKEDDRGKPTKKPDSKEGEQPAKGEEKGQPGDKPAEGKDGKAYSYEGVAQQSEALVNEIAKKDPKLAGQMKESLDTMLAALKEREESEGKDAKKAKAADDEVTGNAKSFLRAFQSSAAPASMIGHELGGLLAEQAEKERAKQGGGAAEGKAKPGEKQELKGEEAPPETKPPGGAGKAEKSMRFVVPLQQGPRVVLPLRKSQLDLFGGGGGDSKGGGGGGAPKPPSGFQPVKGSKKGGFKKMVGGKWVYWYPGDPAPKAEKQKTEGSSTWQKTEGGAYTMEVGGKQATLTRGKGGWSLSYDGASVGLGKRASFDAAEGALQQMLRKPKGEAYDPSQRKRYGMPSLETEMRFRESVLPSLAKLAKFNNGEWRSERQAAFLMGIAHEVSEPDAERWASQQGIPVDDSTAVVTTIKKLDMFGHKDPSKIRHTATVMVVDKGGVRAILKPKVHHADGVIDFDRPGEVKFERKGEPSITHDVLEDRRAAEKENKPYLERLRETEVYRDVKMEDRSYEIISSLVTQMEEGKTLSPKQKALVERLAPDTGSFKGKASRTYSDYKKQLKRAVRIFGELTGEHAEHAKKRVAHFDDAYVANLKAGGKRAQELVENDFKGQDDTEATRLGLNAADDALWAMVRAVRGGVPTAGNAAEYMATTFGKIQRSKRDKPTKPMTQVVATAEAVAERLGRMSDAQIREFLESASFGGDVRKSTLVVPLSKAGAVGPVPTIAPIHGSAPRAETPPMPDFQEIYYQPKDRSTRKVEEAHQQNRRAAAAHRTTAAYGFHGVATRPHEPVLHYVPTDAPARRPTASFDSEQKRRMAAGRRIFVNHTGQLAGHEDEEDDEKRKTKSTVTPNELIKKAAEWLSKGGAHKYVKRVPYIDGKGRKRYRYYYSESAVARDVKAGEEIRLGKQMVTVADVGDDGTVTLRYPNGSEVKVEPDNWSSFMARHYGQRYYDWAERRAKQSINAVLQHVPMAYLKDLKGSTDAERLRDLQKRVPEVYARLEKRFARAGVNPFRAKQILAMTLTSRGWEPEARAAVVGDVLLKRTHQKRVGEVIRGAENLAGGGQVTAKHVGAVVELVGATTSPDVAGNVAELATRAEKELAELSKVLASARKGDDRAKAEAYAKALSATASQKLTLLAQAFPALQDRAIEPARQALLEAPSLAPAKAPKQYGSETALYVSGEGGQPKALKARYRLMEAGDAKASHDPTKSFQRRGDYPDDVQERAYHRDKGEQAKVIRNAQKLNAAFLVNTNPDAVNGPPMVTKDGVTLGGNSRTMSMQLAYERHPEKAKEMREYLQTHAHQFGLSPEDVAGMERPILVREVDVEDPSKQNLQVLVRQMNESFTQGMDPRTMQVAMGRKLTDRTLEALADDMKPDETLNAFLSSSRAERFVNGLYREGIIDARNSSQYMMKGTKKLNEDGKQMIASVLVGRLVGDADLLSNTKPSMIESVARSVPYMFQAKGYGKKYDISGDMAVAMSAYNDLQYRAESGAIPALDSKMPASRFEGLFGYFDSLFDDKHPIVDNQKARKLLEVLIRKPGSRQMPDVFKAYASEVSKEGPEDQGGMFGAPKGADDILSKVVEAALSDESE